MAIARAIDSAQYRGWHLARTLRTSGGVASDVSGWEVALAPFEASLATTYDNVGAPLFPSDAEVEKWADSALHACSTVSLLDRVMAQGSSAGLGGTANDAGSAAYEESADGDDLAIDTEVLFTELGHRDDIVSVRDLVRETQRNALAGLAKERGKVLALMRARARPWQTHFASYGSSPAIDWWYFRLGALLMRRMLAFSHVPQDASFSGIQYRVFVEVIADEITFALKHLDFCALLRERHPTLRWSNLLTIWQDVADVRTTAQERHGLDTSAARTVIRTLTWEAGLRGGPQEFRTLGPTTPFSLRAPLPLFLRISKNQHLFLLSGVLGEPLRYLHSRLRQTYPEDWAAACPGMVRQLATRVGGMLPPGSYRLPLSGAAAAPAVFQMIDEPLVIAPHVNQDDDETPFTPLNARTIVRVAAELDVRTLPPTKESGDEIDMSIEQFARTALNAQPQAAFSDRLRREAGRKREQLRVERLPMVLQLERGSRPITLWSPDIFAPPMPHAAGRSLHRQAIDSMQHAVDVEERALLARTKGIDRRHIVALLLGAVDRRMSFSGALRSDLPVDNGEVQPAEESRPQEEAEGESLHLAPDLRFGFGLTRLLGLFAGTDVDREWPPREAQPVHNGFWADAAARRAGEIASLAQVIDMLRTGLATVTRDSARSWTVRLEHSPRGVERREAAHLFALGARLRRTRRDLVERLEREQRGLAKRLLKYVKLTNGRELSISPPPRVYRHFLEAALHSADQMIGPDAFPGNAVFGSLPFSVYRWLTLATAAEALLRVTASEALSHRDASLGPAVIRTTWWRLPVLARRLGELTGISETEARAAIEPLVLDQTGAAVFHKSARPALPPLVRIAPDGALMSTWGCLDEPFQFLLVRLRQLYPSDWDRAVDSRERIFRNDVYDALVSDSSGRFYTSPTGVKIRERGRVLTDIDAIVYDRLTGDLALFQLKWQDPFGASLGKRASAAKNFSVGASEWVRVVSDWLPLIPPERLCARLGVQGQGHASVRPRLFVLGRFASHFSDHGLPSVRAAWGTWPQVLNLTGRTRDEPSLRSAALQARSLG
ncbi:MAG: hypothetical protein ACJ79K_04870 [Gemmatimonadaceae bacterium]